MKEGFTLKKKKEEDKESFPESIQILGWSHKKKKIPIRKGELRTLEGKNLGEREIW
jgi:hypothetical protein